MPAHNKHHHHQNHKTILLEAEPDPSNPASFLAKCKAIVEEITEPVVKNVVNNVPLVIRHRVQDFRPRARAIHLRRRVKLFVPSWNEKSSKNIETGVGVILILIGAMLVYTADIESIKHDSPLQQTNPVAGIELVQTEAPMMDHSATVEMPFLADAAIDPAFLQQMAPQSNTHPFSRFHSYADPKSRFAFNPINNMNQSYQMSTNAACGMATHFQHSMPVMIQHGKKTVWDRQHGSHKSNYSMTNTADNGKDQEQLRRRVMNHPLLGRMMHQVKQESFQKYVNNGTFNASAIPMMRVAHQYHSLSQVLKQSCGHQEKAESEDE